MHSNPLGCLWAGGINKTKSNPPMTTQAKAKQPKKNAADKAAPIRDGHLTAAVKKNMPANWAGTDKQYMELYAHNLAGLQAQIEKVFAQLFPDAARVAMMKKKDLETPVVELIAKVKIDFSDLDVAQFNGGLQFVETKKHDAAMGFVEELNPKGPGKQTDMINNPPTAASPTLKVINGGKPENTVKDTNAPSNKGAPAATNKGGSKATKRAAKAPTPPTAPTETSQPATGAPAATGSTAKSGE